MNNISHFDLLIVYSESQAYSASHCCHTDLAPFSAGSRNASYNIVYGYFLACCRRWHLKAAFTTSADIIGPGLCRSSWTFSHNRWHKITKACYSPLIFDKFSPTKPGIKTRRQLLFSSPSVQPFNDPDLFDLFFDKQLTYEKLTGHAIPTIAITDSSPDGIQAACRRLNHMTSRHPGVRDFTTDLIMKDRFGAGGRRVYKFPSGHSRAMALTISRNVNISYIIQPFAKFDRGFSYLNLTAATDIRLVFLQGKIVQSYIRVARSGEFRCNEHQGGTLTYLPPAYLPASLLVKAQTVAGLLDNKTSLYALDFIITNSGTAYLLEGNTGPGLDWNTAVIKNATEAKKLIRLVVKELALRSDPAVAKSFTYPINHSSFFHTQSL